tara:strand:- start:7 stop:552 length:546 start_codon:yes stop_codon:yes gene_type:complete
MKIFTLALIAIAGSSLAWAEGIEDDFSTPVMEGRSALRGEWVFEGNVASCVADPELYVEFANHGPILRWPVKFTEGTAELEFKPKGCQRAIVTLNNETGHVFRMTIGDEVNARTRVFGWAGPSHDTSSETLAQEGVPTLTEVNDSWVKVNVSFKGDQAIVQIGDFSKTVEHASAGREKLTG